MRKIALLAGLGAALITCGAHAATPEKLVYRCYRDGQFAGTCTIEREEKGDAIVFKSSSRIDSPSFRQSLECFTEYDRETLAPRYYSYRGGRMDDEIEGVIDFTPNSIKGEVTVNGTTFPSQQPPQGQVVLFEHYVMEHQSILLWTLARSSDLLIRFNLFFPSDFTQAPTVAMIESEVELPLLPKPAVCSKYSVSIQSSDTFFGYFDPEREAAVYMDYPSVQVEMFLESAWGDSPPVKYVSAPKSAAEAKK